AFSWAEFQNGSGGHRFANPNHVMIATVSARIPRRKAVRGPNRLLVAAVGLAVVASTASNAFAGPGARRVGPGRPNSYAKSYKLDSELSRRSVSANAASTTRVIVEWQPGATVSPAFKHFARRNGNLGLLNGTVLDVPNGLLRSLAADPSVLRV